MRPPMNKVFVPSLLSSTPSRPPPQVLAPPTNGVVHTPPASISLEPRIDGFTSPYLLSIPTTPSSQAPVPLSREEVLETLNRIKVNQEYQEILQESLKTLEKSLARNKELQVRLCQLQCTFFMLSLFVIPFYSAYFAFLTFDVHSIDLIEP